MGTPTPVERIHGGFNSTHPPQFLQPGTCQVAQDCRFDTNDCTKREGFQRIVSSTDAVPCLSFAPARSNGIDPFVRIPDFAGIEQQTNLTLEILFNPDSVTGTQTILAKGRFATVAQIEYELYLVGTALHFDYYRVLTGIVDVALTATTTFAAGNTYYMAIQKSGTTIKLWVGNVTTSSVPTAEATGTTTVAVSTTAFPLILGCRPQFGDMNVGLANLDGTKSPTQQPFSGRLAELRAWSAARTDASLTANYNKWLDSTDTANLAAYWHLNEATGFNVLTTDGNANHTGSLHPIAPGFTTALVGDQTINGAILDNDPTRLVLPAGQNQSYDAVWETTAAPNNIVGTGGAPSAIYWPALYTAINNGSAASPPGATWTIEFKVKFNTVTTPQVLVSYAFFSTTAASVQTYFQVRLETVGGGPRLVGIIRDSFSAGGGTQDVLCGAADGSPAALVAGTTYHVALVRATTVSTLYVNGAAYGATGALTTSSTIGVDISGNTRVAIGAAGTKFGGNGTNVSLSFSSSASVTPLPIQKAIFGSADASFDEFRFWNVDRSAMTGVGGNKITELKDTTLFDASGERTGLIGYFSCDDNETDQFVQMAVVLRDDQVSQAAFLSNPNSAPPTWMPGLITQTTVDSTGVANAQPPSVLGVFNFQANDGTQYLLKRQGVTVSAMPSVAANGMTAKVWNRLRTNRTPGYNRFPIGNSNLEFFASHRNRVYSGNNSDFLLRFDGTNVQRAGIYPPRLAPVITGEDTGKATGVSPSTTVDYVFTAFNSALQLESNPSPFVRFTASVVAGSPAQHQLSVRVNGHGDPQVDRLRIYRRIEGVGGVPSSTIFYLAGEVPNPTAKAQGTATFLDTNSTVGLSSVNFIDPELLNPFGHDPPPVGGRVLLTFKNRLYVAGMRDRPQDVAYSQLDFPDYFPVNNFLRLEDKDGSPVTALGALYDVGVVFKANSLWHFATDNAFWSLSKIHEGIGCISPATVVNLDQNTLFFLSTRGPYVYDGQRLFYVGKRIEKDVQSWQRSRLGAAIAVPYRRRGQVFLSVSKTSTSANDTVYVFDVRSLLRAEDGGSFIARLAGEVEGEQPESAWSTYTWNAQSLHWNFDSSGVERVFLGDAWGYVSTIEGATSDGPKVIFPSGTATGTIQGTATSGTTTTLTDSTATFQTLNDGLRGLKLRLKQATDQDVTIVSNTATQLTFTPALSVAVASGIAYRIGTIAFNVLTREIPLQENLFRTTADHIRVMTNVPGSTTSFSESTPSTVDLSVRVEADLGTVTGSTTSQDLKAAGPYAQYRTGGARGRTLSVRLKNDQVNAPITVYGISVSADPGQER